MPVMQTFAKVDARAMQRVDERGFHKARFIDRAARMIVRARCPFDHPVKDFELAELCLPLRDTFSAQIIYKGMLTWPRAHSKQGTQFFIKQIPFLFEAV